MMLAKNEGRRTSLENERAGKTIGNLTTSTSLHTSTAWISAFTRLLPHPQQRFSSARSLSLPPHPPEPAPVYY
jgi:hypothetical protein